MKLSISFKTLPIAIASLFLSLSLSAQNRDDMRRYKTTPGDRYESADRHYDSDYERELNLTADQKKAFKRADEQYKAKAKAIKAEKKEELRRLRDARKRAHRAVLTREQLRKYDEIQVRKEAKRAEKHARKSQQKADKKAWKAEKKDRKIENKSIRRELERQ